MIVLKDVTTFKATCTKFSHPPTDTQRLHFVVLKA